MKAAVLAIAIAILDIACARPSAVAPVQASAPKPMTFVEVARAEMRGTKLAPTLSLCEAGPPLVCGRRQVLRIEGDRAVRDEALERGLPHDAETGDVAGTVAQIVGHLPDRAWLRLQRPGDGEDFCEDVYRSTGDAWERVGVPHCHSLAASLWIVARRSDALVVSADPEAPVRFRASSGAVVGEGSLPSCGGWAHVVVREDDSVFAAHAACEPDGDVVEEWSAKLGRARVHALPGGVFVYGLTEGLVAYGMGEQGPWLARLDGDHWIPSTVTIGSPSLGAWGRDVAGVEWAIAGEKVVRRTPGGSFESVAIGPGTPQELHVQANGEVWIEVTHEGGARALVRGAVR